MRKRCASTTPGRTTIKQKIILIFAKISHTDRENLKIGPNQPMSNLFHLTLAPGRERMWAGEISICETPSPPFHPFALTRKSHQSHIQKTAMAFRGHGFEAHVTCVSRQRFCKIMFKWIIRDHTAHVAIQCIQPHDEHSCRSSSLGRRWSGARCHNTR